jgi:RNA polymerase sigma-70 factor (ECF subfamily)
MTDAQWLAAIRAGDDEAFLTFYRQYQGGIYRFLLRMSGEESVAQDLTQEVFLVLWRAKDGAGFDGARGTLIGYLYGVARHLVWRRMEREGRWVPLSEESGSEEYSELPGAMESTENPLDRLTREETVARLRQLVLALPGHYREAVVLCDLHEMTYQQAAEVLDCSVGTVRSRLHRGRSLLAERWHRGDRAEAGQLEVAGDGLRRAGKPE